jgi:hypothetical protein
MLDLWYFIVAVAVSVGAFFGIWISKIAHRREWNRLQRERKVVVDGLRELDRRRQEWRHLQGLNREDITYTYDRCRPSPW